MTEAKKVKKRNMLKKQDENVQKAKEALHQLAKTYFGYKNIPGSEIRDLEEKYNVKIMAVHLIHSGWTGVDILLDEYKTGADRLQIIPEMPFEMKNGYVKYKGRTRKTN